MQKLENIIIKKSLINNLIDLTDKSMKLALKNEGEKSYNIKQDGTFVTNTDIDIHNLLKQGLVEINNNVPVISEEEKFDPALFLKNLYWLIDPLDGTSNFVNGGKGYTINIALIKKGVPILGIIAHPPSDTIWYGYLDRAFMIKNGKKKKIEVLKSANDNLKIIMSKREDKITKKFVNKITNASINFFSSSLKFCKIAEGDAHIYPRLTSISKWDIAAGDGLLRAAGGILLNEKGKKLIYNTESIKTGKFFAISSTKIWKKYIKPNV